MKKVLFLVFALTLVLAFGAQATILYWDGTTAAGAITQGSTDGAGLWSAGSVFPDAWSASSAVSTARNNASPYTRTKSAYNTTSGQAAFAEIQFNLTAAGYWDIAATNPSSNIGVGAIKVSSVNNWVGLPTSTSIFSTANAWNSMGIYKATSTTPKIRFDENGVTTNRWYLDQMRLTSATPGAATSLAKSATQLSWVVGNYSSGFDVALKIGSTSVQSWTGLAEGTVSVPLPTLLPGTTYTWTVTAKNVDMSTVSSASFTTEAVPEPGTVAAALALLAPAGMMFRRRRA